MTEARSDLRRFLHDVATPLSALSLHLELAARQTARGEDPSEALNVARAELDKALEAFEGGRDRLLKGSETER